MMNEQLLMDPVRTEIEELTEVILFQAAGDGPALAAFEIEIEIPDDKGGDGEGKGGGTNNEVDANMENMENMVDEGK
jgi:hypothetical protein